MNDALQFTQTLPKKRMASGALFRNEQGQFLLVNPTYRERWLIPGGTVEASESPMTTCIREVEEEINLHCELKHLLCLDYMPQSEEGTEALHFIFDGGVLTKQQIANIQLPADELSEYLFVDATQLQAYLPTPLFLRVNVAIANLSGSETCYLEAGLLPQRSSFVR